LAAKRIHLTGAPRKPRGDVDTRRHLLMPSPVSERAFQTFWTYVEVAPTGCWLWNGAGCDGIPKFGGFGDDHTYNASRASYYLSRGKDPGDLLVCHKCDNPRCVNPLHLFLGTEEDNIQDCIRKGRFSMHWKKQDRKNGSWTKRSEAEG
jgi:hypothetical protein